ncbi:MAG: glycosyltransferase family 1 protein [Verrucomicrobia bacterium]|nr:glycosyltransferase family 1 protein [Verrucomicrobiota bacterium]
MRIFVDGTESFWRPENRTGIQRVVREVCRRCGAQAPAGTEVIPVQFDGRNWGGYGGAEGRTYGIFFQARQLAARCRAWRRLSRAEWKASPAKLWLILAMLGGLVGTVLASVCASLMRRVLTAWPAPVMQSGDVLLIVDYPVQRRATVMAAKARGVRIVAVIYDCVPLTHPQFYRHEKDFGEHFDWSLAHARGIMTISAFSEREIDARRPAGGPWVDHFHLGADFARPAASRPPRPDLAPAFTRPCFLMVGTLAPHKNHLQALDAMDLRWRAGSEAHLLIVGKVGWQADALLGRISKHPELGRRLFVFHDLNDDELALAYARSHALIAASYVEGFGLPLVEALGSGLPVVAADIPVFREIGGTAVTFFPLDDAGALAQVLARVEAAPRRQVEAWKWLSWDESTRLLLDKVRARMSA